MPILSMFLHSKSLLMESYALEKSIITRNVSRFFIFRRTMTSLRTMVCSRHDLPLIKPACGGHNLLRTNSSMYRARMCVKTLAKVGIRLIPLQFDTPSASSWFDLLGFGMGMMMDVDQADGHASISINRLKKVSNKSTIGPLNTVMAYFKCSTVNLSIPGDFPLDW